MTQCGGKCTCCCFLTKEEEEEEDAENGEMQFSESKHEMKMDSRRSCFFVFFDETLKVGF